MDLTELKDKQTSLKVLGRVAKLSVDDMNKLNASIAKLNKLDIKTKLASKELKNFSFIKIAEWCYGFKILI
ncbi:hypothetical protein AVBRAN12642_03965 [Campylobacter sp. RM12642]|uniref:hypothetical protein n=1 Tax=Campylobacter sp. RM12642 TaxID=2735736 RepID=UPI0030143E9C|nr:hypothetical protein [Campylobacter sp. RM12642]